MSLYAMADNNVEIPVVRDAALYNALSGNQDFVIGGVGNELSCSANSLTVTLQSGEGVIQGRHVTCIGTETVQVSGNASGTIVLRYDLTKSAGNEAYLTAVNLVVQDDLSNGGTIRDLPLYRYSSTSSSVTLTDARNLLTSPLGDQVRFTLTGSDLYIEVLD